MIDGDPHNPAKINCPSGLSTVADAAVRTHLRLACDEVITNDMARAFFCDHGCHCHHDPCHVCGAAKAETRAPLLDRVRRLFA